jgi:hypothetical protein
MSLSKIARTIMLSIADFRGRLRARKRGMAAA